MKKVEQTIKAIARFEMANLDNKDFVADMENYCIGNGSGYFFGFCRKLQRNYTKKQVKKATT